MVYEILAKMSQEVIYNISMFFSKTSIGLITDAEKIINHSMINVLQVFSVILCVLFLGYKLMNDRKNKENKIVYIKNGLMIVLCMFLIKYLVKFSFNTWGTFVSEVEILERVQSIFEVMGKDLVFNSSTLYSILAIIGYTMLITTTAIIQTIEAVSIGISMVIVPFVLLASFNNKKILKTFNKDLFGILIPQIITPILLNLFIPIIINFKGEIVGAKELLLLLVVIMICYKCPSILHSCIDKVCNKIGNKKVINDLNLEKDSSDLFTIV